MNMSTASSLIITDLIIEFSDSSSRYATIYGNGLNQVPVNVTIGITGPNGPVSGLDKAILAESLTFFHKKDDSPIHKGIPVKLSKGLYSSEKNYNFNHAQYGHSDTLPSTDYADENDGIYKIPFYLSSTEEHANFVIYAKIKATGITEFTSDKEKCLNISVLTPLQWCYPESWEIKKSPSALPLDLSVDNSSEPLDSVTFKPTGGSKKRGNISMALNIFWLKYHDKLKLPPPSVRGDKFSNTSDFYDMSGNSIPDSITTYSRTDTPLYENNDLVLWYLRSESDNAPTLKNNVKFLIGVNPTGARGSHKDIYMETINIPDDVKIPAPVRGGLTLYRLHFRHVNTEFFITNSPEAHACRDLIVDMTDDFGNHGSIKAKLKGLETPDITYVIDSLPGL